MISEARYREIMKENDQNNSGCYTNEPSSFVNNLRDILIRQYLESGIGSIDPKEIALLQAVSTSMLTEILDPIKFSETNLEEIARAIEDKSE